jgi:hypothetical protein
MTLQCSENYRLFASHGHNKTTNDYTLGLHCLTRKVADLTAECNTTGTATPCRSNALNEVIYHEQVSLRIPQTSHHLCLCGAA